VLAAGQRISSESVLFEHHCILNIRSRHFIGCVVQLGGQIRSAFIEFPHYYDTFWVLRLPLIESALRPMGYSDFIMCYSKHQFPIVKATIKVLSILHLFRVSLEITNLFYLCTIFSWPVLN
jgi:hypothetical protein